jgi:excisionase family DNA binding protein
VTEWIRTRVAAEMLDISTNTVMVLIREGRLTAIKVRGWWQIDPASVEELKPLVKPRWHRGKSIFDDEAPCGTPTAYQRHWRNGEPIDEACRKAHAAHALVQFHKGKEEA